jgi:glycosyltransferase involved in cell wall biosynthesis
MRIAYITGRYPAISHTFITREVRALRERGVEIDTFTVWATDEASLLSQVDREERASTYALLPLRLRTLAAHLAAFRAGPRAYVAMGRQALALRRSGLRGFVMALAWFAEAGALWHQCARREIRHVHAHINGTAPVLAMLAAQLGNSLGGPEWRWSMTVHGPSEFYDSLQERLGEKVRAATFVVCISDFARSQLMGMVEAEHWPKLRIVHCGVDTEAFGPAPGRDDDRPVRILNVGRLTPVKGQALLVEALAQLRADGVEAALTIVGEGPARAEIESAARRLGVAEHVSLLGAVGQGEIRALYEEASIFCLSSFAEGVPVVLMEAMAMEIPVVAPAIMGIPELVESGVSGVLVRPGRADQMADAVRDLARSPEARAKLGRAARRTVLDEFEIDRSAEQLAALFGAGARQTPTPEPVGVR